MRQNKEMILFYDGPFSQWHYSPFTINNREFNRAEQFMMYSKAIHFHDYETALNILCEDRPDRQKALGRIVKNFIKEEWESVGYKYVVDGNIAKFSQNRNLRDILLETSGLEIVEASPTDCIWGIGIDERSKDAFDRSKWRGQNLLGKALMEVRALLRK